MFVGTAASFQVQITWNSCVLNTVHKSVLAEKHRFDARGNATEAGN